MTSTRPLSPTQARQRAARARRRRTLGLDAIVDVALAIVDTEGVDAVSMRRVAAEFNTGPASLYAYVANKDALLAQVLDQVLAEVRMPFEGSWQERLRLWAHETRNVLARHNDVARLTFGMVPVSEQMFDGTEGMLRSMIEGGVPAQVSAWALDILALYVGADVFEGSLWAKRFHDGSGRDPEEAGAEYFQDIAAQMAQLSAERFPYIMRTLPLMMNGDSDERFAFGIDMLIAGFAAQIPHS